MNAMAAIKAYQKVGKESAINGADAHELISMLFQGALVAIADARRQIAQKETIAKGRSISRAIAIIGEGLHAGLDMNAGGSLAQDMAAIYGYLVQRLVAANLQNDIAALDEVARLLSGLAEAWNSIRPKLMTAEAQPGAATLAQRAYSVA